MAKRTLYATKDMRDPIYRTRMLKAGEPIELSGPDARLYLHLGVVTDRKPRAKPGPDAVTNNAGESPAKTTTRAAETAAPKRRRAARKRKSA